LLLKVFIILKDFKPDILHAHLHEGAFIAWIVRSMTRKPFVFDYQGSLTEEITAHGFIRAKGFLHSLACRAERFIEKRANHIITSSMSSGERLARVHSGKPIAVDTVADGVDTECFRRNGGRPVIRRKHGIPDDAPVIVYLGLLDEYQGTPNLLRAMRHVLDIVPECRLLVGGYPNEARYQAMADDLGVGERVIFTGRVDYRTAADFLSAGDVAVAPKLSQTEANGKLLNYMACSLPCVCYDSPSNREILGDSGVYVNGNDERGLADAMVRLLANPSLARQLGDAARSRAIKEHGWHERAARITTAYEMVLSTGGTLAPAVPYKA